MYYGPSDFQTPNIISIGPLRRLLQPITNDTVNLLILEQPKPEVIYPQEYPSDFQTPNIISIGPLRRLLQPITNDTVNLLILEQPKPEVIYPQEYPSKAGDNTMTVAIVVGVLGALALVSIILALFLLLIKIRNRPNNSGFNMTGKENQAYAT